MIDHPLNLALPALVHTQNTGGHTQNYGRCPRRLPCSLEALATDIWERPQRHLHSCLVVADAAAVCGSAHTVSCSRCVIRLLDDCHPQQLEALATQQGFAGRTDVAGDICTWNRELDYQPKSGPADVGKMRFVTHDILMEDDPSGLHAYHEEWHRLKRSSHECWSYRLQAIDQPQRHGFLLGSGLFFFFAADRMTDMPPDGTLLSQMQASSKEDQCRMLQMELSFGTISDSKTAPWTILHSTLPGRVGQTLFDGNWTVEHVQKAAQSYSPVNIGVFAPRGGWQVLPAAGTLSALTM